MRLCLLIRRAVRYDSDALVDADSEALVDAVLMRLCFADSDALVDADSKLMYLLTQRHLC